ncbi:spore coat polysaccharide biosynthesis protein SpsF (cytidylyltransferase family) [Halomonas ventosae]|uniref:Spore coat polysaccharide biosynthesis protein SpsF (Cytidylyltransferase family) n=1 Tax=Halomonas ventosae TaxID=229007 RepID=A0A4R6ZWE0_9GAMM|nr:aldo/keto reductase [Halomonas ventosae]TDR57251.1 spore coat polysaccharide biosynthesis protein SpsF (cytidylyltransferase family) [Halomonas ventosae]
MKAILLLQARTNSSRLPGKVLLPVAGMPLVVLAALRAGNSGHRVVVLTSGESSDDALCGLLDEWDADYFRGDLENTLKRFVDALESEPDDKIVVRLTGDNVFPDGVFIDRMIEYFEHRDVAYLCCSGSESGLPYGVSAEVTRVKYLREAHHETTSKFDREHVTPWIVSKYGQKNFDYYRYFNMAQYRCTVDTLDDYLLVNKLFYNKNNAVYISLEELLYKLKRVSLDVVSQTPAHRMVLGTAQFGLEYGIANSLGRPKQDVVNNLVHAAIANGVKYLDTARAYGESERVVGKALAGGWSSRVDTITKLSPFSDCPEDAGPDVVRAYAERSVLQSCHALGVKKLDVLMLHRADHLTAWNSAVWDAVVQLKQQAFIGQLGVSLQTPEEALQALDFEDISFIQLPFNILDYRWDGVIKKISAVRQSRSLIVHARSSLLQGLLSSESEKLWKRAKCSNFSEVTGWLSEKAKHYTNGNVVELCFRYSLSQDWIDGVVVGVDSRNQLLENIIMAGEKRWSGDQLKRIVSDRPRVTKETLNPATWKHEDE